jgi:DNA-binding transcriptional regulator YbjK
LKWLLSIYKENSALETNPLRLSGEELLNGWCDGETASGLRLKINLNTLNFTVNPRELNRKLWLKIISRIYGLMLLQIKIKNYH